MRRESCFKHAGGKHDAGHDQTCDAQRLAELIQPPLQRGFFFFNRLQHGGDQPQLGEHACAGDHAHAAAVSDHSAAEGGVLAVAKGGGIIHHRSGILLHRNGLTRERGFLHLEVDRFQQAHIGRNEVAGFQEDDVAWHQLAGGNRNTMPVPQRLSLRRSHLFKRFQLLLGFTFLHNAHDGVQHHNGHNGNRVDGLSQQR